MKVIREIETLSQIHGDKVPIGFVPTMGALHDGHLSLVRASKSRGLFTIASIFVNPTQFNNQADLDAYPLDIEEDIRKLESVECDAVFIPTREMIYPEGKDQRSYLHDFGSLEQRYEGAYRPGHFKGVGQVVHILFDLVKPQVAFFGLKDFQQVQVIRALVDMAKMPIEIVALPTVREEDGLAMSSRNRRLSASQRESATLLYHAMLEAKKRISSSTPAQIKQYVHSLFDSKEDIRLEYFDIIDPSTFKAFNETSKGHPHAIVAAYVGEVRLIDNLAL